MQYPVEPKICLWPRLLSAMAVAVVLTSCARLAPLYKPEYVDSRDEAASVLITPTVVIPWSQVSDEFQPNFALSGDQALLQVLPVTQRIEEQVFSAFGANLGVGFPTRTAQSTQVHGTSTGNTVTVGGESPGTVSTAEDTSSSNSTVTRQSGTAPVTPTGIPAGAQLRTYAPVTGDLGVDPILKYQSALALFESVQMLNRQVRNAAKLHDSVPFLVRLKIAILPYRPHLGYTLHSRVSFFPGSWWELVEEAESGGGNDDASKTSETPISPSAPASEAKCKDGDEDPKLVMPQILPLLAADDIERALKSRAVEAAQQIGLAVSLMSGGTAGSLGLNKVNQQMAAISGQDFNSRLTIARQSDNTMYVRVGASNEASGGAALVGQTYDVAVLLLVPRAYFDGCNNPDFDKPQIRVVSHTQFRKADDGTVLADRPEATYVKQIDAVMEQLLSAPPNASVLAAWHALLEIDKLQVARELAIPIQTNELGRFAKLFEGQIPNTTFSLKNYANGDLWAIQNAWTAFSRVLADAPMSSAYFELPMPRDLIIPAQTALLLDDGKEKADVRLAGVTGDSAATLGGTVSLRPKGTQRLITLAVHGMVLDGASHLLSLSLPSPAKWGVSEIDETDPDNKLILTQYACDQDPMCPNLVGANNRSITFPIALAKAEAQDPKPGFAMTATSKRVVADKVGAGKVTVTIDKLKDDSATVTVTEADLIGASSPGGGAIVMTGSSVALKTNGSLTLQLNNLRAGARFTVVGEGKKGSKTTGKTSIEFEVVTN